MPMTHTGRTFRVIAVDSAADLAARLTSRVWAMCTAFALGDLVFANDAFGESEAQQYAVVRDGREIESITFSWITEADARGFIEEIVAGTLGGDYGAVDLRTDHPVEANSCPLCA